MRRRSRQSEDLDIVGSASESLASHVRVVEKKRCTSSSPNVRTQRQEGVIRVRGVGRPDVGERPLDQNQARPACHTGEEAAYSERCKALRVRSAESEETEDRDGD